MSGRVTSSPSNLARAEAVWGDELPDWVRLMATACDVKGQRATAAEVGISQREVSRILNRQFSGDYEDAAFRLFDRVAEPPVRVPSPEPATNIAKARAAWGDEPPRWVRLLAEQCDLSSQSMTAAKLGKSSTWVSRLINRAYAGSYPEAEEQVLARLGGDQVLCPIWAAMGTIPLISCIRTRRKTNHSGPMLEWARLCRTCPHNTDLQETK